MAEKNGHKIHLIVLCQTIPIFQWLICTESWSNRFYLFIQYKIHSSSSN